MKTKLVISLILAFLVFVFVTQNAETVRVDFLAWSTEMSVVLLVFIMLGSGIIIGWLLSSYLRFAGHRKQNKGQHQLPVKEAAGPHKQTVQTDTEGGRKTP